MLRVAKRRSEARLLLRRLRAVAPGGRVAAGRAEPVRAVPARRDRAHGQDRPWLCDSAAAGCRSGRKLGTASSLRDSPRLLRESWLGTESWLRAEGGLGRRVAARCGRVLRARRRLTRETRRRLSGIAGVFAGHARRPSETAIAVLAAAHHRAWRSLARIILPGLVAGLESVSLAKPAARILRSAVGGARSLVPARPPAEPVRVGLRRLRDRGTLDGHVV